MDSTDADYLTTSELAVLLRISERKVYDLAAGGDVPCVRVVGKLLFPRADIRAWMHEARSGPDPEPSPLPAILVGSHDPLLDWALRESGSGIAGFFDGSLDGIGRLAVRQAMASGLHVHEAEGWNVATADAALGSEPVVLVEFARRQRGLIVAADNPRSVTGFGDLAGCRFARRQSSAASQGLFEELAAAAGIDPARLTGPETPARTEDDVARLVLEGKADAAFGLESVAREMRLGFLPVIEERFDLLVWRQAWFEPPFQQLFNFLRSPAFAARAGEIGGYDISGLGRVHLNGGG